MCDDLIVDLRNRDGDLLFSDKNLNVSVSKLKQSIQMQKVHECAVRPMPSFCVSTLAQPVFDHEIF